MPEKKFETVDQELAYLREQVAAQERVLAERSGGARPEAVREATTHEVVKAYAEHEPAKVLHPDMRMEKAAANEIVLQLAPEAHDKKIEQLVALMYQKGVANVFALLEKLDDAHLTDDFHRFLVQYIKANYEVIGLKPAGKIWNALHMTLYEVTLPEKTGDVERERAIKEVISSMEQFYSGMLSVEDDRGTGYFAIELAVANHSDDFTFYVAVHDNKKSLFEKQMLSVFHNAKIVEKKDDYNIFNEEGSTVASEARLGKNSIWPIKTYDQFDYDPLNSILNSFSKVKTHGEGASIQIIVRPQDGEHIKRYKKTLDEILAGEKVTKAIANNDKGVGEYVEGFFSGVGQLFSSPEKLKEKKEKEENKKKDAIQHLDQVAVEEIKRKIASPVVSVNMRIVASAETMAQAEMIRADIEAAFNQFADPTGNTVEFTPIRTGALKEFLRDYSYRLSGESHRMLINIRELTSLMHFPSTQIKSAPHLKIAKAGTAPAPMDLPQNGTLLGTNSDRGVERQVFLTPEDRLRHLYVIGQTGTGKTTLLKNMIIQDIQAGNGVCFIDPHGSDIQDVLANIPPERVNDVIYFDPAYIDRPMALNMLEYDRRYPEQKTFVVNEMLSIFNKLFDMKTAGGPMFEQYFRNAVLLTIDDPTTGSTLVDVSRVLSNKTFRDLKLSKCTNPLVVQFWTEVATKAGGEASLANIVPYIVSKFDNFLANDIMRPVIGQEQSSFKFRDVMDSKKILLVNLSKGRLGDINANLIGLILVGKILMAALSRVDSIGTDLPPFYLYIDEFQNITTDSIAAILSEARKYKLSLNVAHQFIAQLDEKIKDAVFGNVGSMVIYRVGAEDAEVFEKQLAPVFTAKDIMNIDNFNAYAKILAKGVPMKPFNIRVPSPLKGDPARAEKYKEISYITYGRARAEVEAEIMAKYKKEEPPKPAAPSAPVMPKSSIPPKSPIIPPAAPASPSSPQI